MREENRREITAYRKVMLPNAVRKKLVNLSLAHTKDTQIKNMLLSDKCSGKAFCQAL